MDNMGIYTRILAACILGALGYVSPGVAKSADLVVLTNQGAAPGVRELAAEFERVSGHRVTVIQPDRATLEQRSSDGTADLVTGAPDVIEELVRDGNVVVSTVTPFVLASLGLAVRAGTPKPDIGTVESYAAALRAAESIVYSTGCSGRQVAEGIAELGLTQELADKTIRIESGPVTDHLARGEGEVGMHQAAIMVDVPGIDYVGLLPGFLNKPCPYHVGLLTASQEPDAARAMIRFMVSSEAAPLLRRVLMEEINP